MSKMKIISASIVSLQSSKYGVKIVIDKTTGLFKKKTESIAYWADEYFEDYPNLTSRFSGATKFDSIEKANESLSRIISNEIPYCFDHSNRKTTIDLEQTNYIACEV